MISEEMKKELFSKFGKDKEANTMMNKHDVQGLVAKFKGAGFDVTEGDVTEFIVGSEGELSEEELDAVSGGNCIYGCPSDSCDHNHQ